MVKKKKRAPKKFKESGRSIISDEIEIPNHSGMLDAGEVHRTPTDDLDPVNKKYVDEQTTPVEFSATSINLVAGTLDSGNVASIQEKNDADIYHIDEVAATPGFDIRVTFANVTHFNSVKTQQRYVGSKTHDVCIELYNVSTTNWDEIATIGNQQVQTLLDIGDIIDTDYVDGSGNVIVRYVHNTGGNASHEILIDYCSIWASKGGSTTPQLWEQGDSGTQLVTAREIDMQDQDIINIKNVIVNDTGSISTAVFAIGDTDTGFSHETGNFAFIVNTNIRILVDSSGNVKIVGGELDMNTHKIINVVDPSENQHAATKKYVDDAFIPTTQQQLEQGIAIIYLEANASITHQDYSTMFLDKFSDADGYDDTVDVGNTTAIFGSLVYANGSDATEIDYFNRANNATVGNGWTETESGNHSCSIDTNKLKILRGGGAGTSYCEKDITADSEYEIAVQGNNTGDSTWEIYFKNKDTGNNIVKFLLSGTNTIHYDIGAGIVDLGITPVLNVDNVIGLKNISYVAHTFDIWIDDVEKVTGIAFDNNEDITRIRCRCGRNSTAGKFDDISQGGAITPANKIVQTDAATVTTAQTHHQLFCNNAVAGSGTVTYDISFDNGSNYDTGQALNTKNTRSAATGTQMILKLNLNGTGAGNTAEASDYAIMLWY